MPASCGREPSVRQRRWTAPTADLDGSDGPRGRRRGHGTWTRQASAYGANRPELGPCATARATLTSPITVVADRLEDKDDDRFVDRKRHTNLLEDERSQLLARYAGVTSVVTSAA